MGHTFNCIIMGAAGRDFHDFQTFFRRHPEFRVRCFTAEQIPFISERAFPKELAGDGYDEDVPIFDEEQLPELIDRFDVDFVFLSYSDLAHEDVMHKASLVQAAGASFALLGPKHTQLVSKRPVMSVTAVRTGAGKSPLSQALAAHLGTRGLKVGVIRHPMPYGDLRKQAVQKFATPEDLELHQCTIEEREEYEPYVTRGLTIYAGVDYAGILEVAEADSDLVLWDGGNNDTSFIESGLKLVVMDALRPGHEVRFYPGETNFRMADVLIISKAGGADEATIAELKARAAAYNPNAKVITADLAIRVEDEAAVAGKRVLCVEDGPTVTHGGMPYGAGKLAAERFGAGEIVDPRPHAVGTLAQAYADYPHMDRVLPALGYSDDQRRELRESILAAAPDLLLDASPAGLGRLLDLDIPLQTVRYVFDQLDGPDLLEIVDAFIDAS